MVELEVNLAKTPPEEPLIELILALPRPIMLQRILKQATVLGVRRFHLIRSNRVQKSFFQTNLLQPEKLMEILVQGLEQTVDTRLPEVLVHHRFMPFVKDIVPTLKSPCRLLADPNERLTLPELYSAGKISGSFSLAIGPEGGWSQHEVRQFAQAGFHCFAMGNRILHVDTAVVALLSQIRLLHELSAFVQGKLSTA
jgi:RsmE family RNA methyltransferase